MDRIARLLSAGALLIAVAPAAAAPSAASDLARRVQPDRAVIDRLIAPRTPPATFPARAAAVHDDARWASEFGAPAFDRRPQAAIAFQGSLVVAGSFTRIGDVYCPGVMRWNGSAWIPMGEGPGGHVYALANVGGALVAAGNFLDPLSQQPIPLKTWNGSTWVPFGPFMRGTAYAITVDGPDVFVLGFLFYSGYANRVLRLNASAWEPVGGAIDGDPRALAVWNGQLVLGGRFDSINGVPIRSLAGWDGFNWTELGGGVTGQADLVASLAVWQNDLIVGGYFESIGGQAISSVARWNGIAWSALGAAVDGAVYALLPDGATLHVGGYLFGAAPFTTSVLSTDGATWSWTEEQPVSQVEALTRYDGELVAVGAFAEIVGPSSARRAFWVARRTGSAWQPVEAWNPAYEGFMGIYGPRMSTLDVYRGDLLVGGPVQARAEGSVWTPFDGVGTWDGTEWRGVGFGPAYADPSFAVAGDTLEVFGANGLEPVQQYDGIAWRELGDFDGWGMLDLQRYSGRLHALGWMAFAGGQGEYRLAQWTGSEWVIVDPGFTIAGGIPGYLSCMTVHAGKLYVAGDFEWVGNVPAHGIAAWDGTTWSAVGPGVSNVFTMRSHGGRLWVGGFFFYAGGVDAVGLASWDGQNWSDGGLSGGTTGVTALGDYDGALVAGGFELVSGTNRYPGIAVFDRGGWHAFGSGIEGWVYDVQQIGTSLYVAGDFATAGGKPSYGLARWDSGVPDRPASPARLRIATANPFAAGVSLAFTMPQEGWVTLTIHDLAGREVARLREGSMGAGYQTVGWVPRRDGARPGIYVARLEALGVVSATKLVVLP